MKSVIDEIPEDSLRVMKCSGVLFDDAGPLQVGDEVIYKDSEQEKKGIYIGLESFAQAVIVRFNNFWTGVYGNGYCRVCTENIQKAPIRRECEVY